MGAAKRRESVAGEYKSRRDPASVCRDIFSVCPWVTEVRRASPAELRAALVRVKKRLPPSSTSGIEDVLGHGGEVPSDGASLLLMAAQFSGSGTQAEKVALELADRIRLSRAPRMKYKYLLAGGARSMDKASEHFRRVARQSDGPLARAVASEREFICEAMRILFTPYAPPGKGLAPPTIRPEGLIQTLAVPRTLSRMAKDAARAETPFLRVFDARYGYLSKYNAPAPKGSQDASIVPLPVKKREVAAAPRRKGSVEPKSKHRTSGRSRPRSPRPARKKRDARNRHSRSPRRRPHGSSAGLAGKGVYEERMSAWLAGEDAKGSLRDKCTNCYVGLGAHAPPHEGRSRQDLGNQCYLMRRARDLRA